MSSGKTLITEVCSYIQTGRGPTLTTHVTDPVEEKKRLISTLIEGPPLVVIDNVSAQLKSDCLSTALTHPSYSDRLLGMNETVTVRTNVPFFATGNNMSVAGDLSSRALLSKLDPEVERPDERSFKRDLHRWVPENRSRLVAAALTVILGYIADGKPDQNVPNYARFEDWQNLCRFPLIWLDMPDPCLTRRSVEANDPVRENLYALLATWNECFGESGATTKAAEERSKEKDHAALHDAIMAVAGREKGINSIKLGKFIEGHAGRIEGGGEGAFRFVAGT